MLLTLTATSLRPMLAPGRGGKPKLTLTDLPAYTRQTLGLHGLNLATDLLAGQSRESLESLRERSDKAGCAALLLIEPEPLAFGDAAEAPGLAAIQRAHRVIDAAHVLGCNSVAVTAAGAEGQAVFERTCERLRRAVERAEKLDLNVLISPGPGLTARPERVTELIKKVGGFRVGTFPDFQTAAGTDDPVAYLRRLTPYAAVVSASTLKFVPDKGADDKEQEGPDAPVKHVGYDLCKLVDAIQSVGYDGTLGVDYRGTGDVTLGVLRSRRLLERLLHQEPEVE